MSNPTITLSDVYIRKLNDFNSYVLGEKYKTNLEQRRNILFDTEYLFYNILKSDQAIVNKVLQHFINNINNNIESYDIEKIILPLKTMKENEFPKKFNIKRLISFINFFVKFTENINDLDRYLFGCDLPYFFRHWPIKQREKLLNFFCYVKS